MDDTDPHDKISSLHQFSSRPLAITIPVGRSVMQHSALACGSPSSCSDIPAKPSRISYSSLPLNQVRKGKPEKI